MIKRTLAAIVVLAFTQAASAYYYNVGLIPGFVPMNGENPDADGRAAFYYDELTDSSTMYLVVWNFTPDTTYDIQWLPGGFFLNAFTTSSYGCAYLVQDGIPGDLTGSDMNIILRTGGSSFVVRAYGENQSWPCW